MSIRTGTILFATGFLLLWAGIAPAAADEVLTNEDIVAMHELGLGDDVILAKIKATPCEFDTSLEAIKAAKAKGISDGVIAAMIGAPAGASGDDDEVDSGIFVVEGDDLADWVRLQANVYSQTKTGGLFKTAITYGAAKAKTRAVLRGAQAAIRVQQDATFMFYFAGGEQTLDASGMPFFFGASTPNEFALVRMEPGKKKKDQDTRQLVIGKFSAWGATGGVQDESVVPFTFEKTGDRTYRVTPEEPLVPGEYCFFFAGAMQLGSGFTGPIGGGRVFDFGVD